MGDGSASLKSFDRVADVYDATRALPPEVAQAAGERIAAIARETSPRPRVLEVGAGTGRIAVPLAAAGVRVAGIDIAPLMLARLRAKRRDIDVMLGEASRPPLRDGAFDALLFVHILHLVPDAEAVLRATLPLLRPGGALVLGYEEYGGLRERADEVMEAIGRELIDGFVTGRERQERVDAAFRRVTGEARGRLERLVAARWTASTTAREMLDSTASRAHSGSWTMSDATIEEMLRRGEPALAALLGGLDAELRFEKRFELLVARTEAAGG